MNTGKFAKQLERLNNLQRDAVETIDGPLLVVAGPGTGKTQLLSMRVANIIQKTDTNPSNVLCLTFTDNAARNMRERLESIIGQPAYHVGIHTFHSFGSEIINQFPDYFTKRQLLQPIDELGRYELLHEIFENLPHSNPLSVKVGDNFIMLKDTLSTISWLKQSALTPEDLGEILNSNESFANSLNYSLSEVFATVPSPKNLNAYKNLLEEMQKLKTEKNIFGFAEYALVCGDELAEAINQIPSEGRYAPSITTWRNKWCQKDNNGKHILKDAGRNLQKMRAVIGVYKELLDKMSALGLYDFDDMIIEVVHALENNDDLRLSLQERYQYILVDEFQDTNKAQLRTLVCLGDNAINEGRPNIMAVGDDDQAIYAFQGADVSNIVAFIKLYEPKLITLKDNYRSTADILSASFAITSQVTDRLEASVPGIDKNLTAKTQHKEQELDHSVFGSELAQYDWVSSQVKEYIKKGTAPEQIAIIAPRHKYLERLMPYLGSKQIPVAYERRENILESPIVVQLLTMSELVVAIAENRQDDIDALVSEVLGYKFWKIPPETILKVSISCYDGHKHWLPVLTKHSDKNLVKIALWFTALARQSKLEPLEYMLDQFIGSPVLDAGESGFVSPMREFYFNQDKYDQKTDEYLTLLGQLSTLRQRLRQWKPTQMLYIKDLVEFTNLHTRAKLKIIDSNPHTQTTNAVQVMTAYKAKGLEFEIVFVINAQDEIWGPTARQRSPLITMPKNLPIGPVSDSNNDKLRLLFVALTRAKQTLRITSYTHTMENKLSPGLSYIGGNTDASEPVHPGLKPQIVSLPGKTEAVEILMTDWAYRFRQVIADKPSLFEPILAKYKLSVTHLNNFIDVREAGPQYFLTHNLLRFPKAPSPSAAYGDAVHKTLQWQHLELRSNNKMPDTAKTQDYFSEMLSRTHIRKTDQEKFNKRGRKALKQYLETRTNSLLAEDLIERGFNNEGSVIAEARLSGKIDKIHISSPGKAGVVDFKTGKPSISWSGKDEFEKVKLYKYRQQLLFYKLLIENSASFGKKLTVTSGALEFIEPDQQGHLVDNLELVFDSEELQRFTLLIGAVWSRIMRLDFPDTSSYSKNLKGIKAFEQDLIDEKI